MSVLCAVVACGHDRCAQGMCNSSAVAVSHVALHCFVGPPSLYKMLTTCWHAEANQRPRFDTIEKLVLVSYIESGGDGGGRRTTSAGNGADAPAYGEWGPPTTARRGSYNDSRDYGTHFGADIVTEYLPIGKATPPGGGSAPAGDDDFYADEPSKEMHDNALRAQRASMMQNGQGLSETSFSSRPSVRRSSLENDTYNDGSAATDSISATHPGDTAAYGQWTKVPKGAPSREALPASNSAVGTSAGARTHDSTYLTSLNTAAAGKDSNHFEGFGNDQAGDDEGYLHVSAKPTKSAKASSVKRSRRQSFVGKFQESFVYESMPRTAAEQLLTENGKTDGLFLVRAKDAGYVISMVCGDRYVDGARFFLSAHVYFFIFFEGGGGGGTSLDHTIV